MHVKVVYDLLFNIWAKVATISGTFRTVKIVNDETAILGLGYNPSLRLIRLVRDLQTSRDLGLMSKWSNDWPSKLSDPVRPIHKSNL